MEIIDPGVMYTHLIATSLRGNSFYLFFLNFALRPLIEHVIDAPPVHSQMSLFKQESLLLEHHQQRSSLFNTLESFCVL